MKKLITTALGGMPFEGDDLAFLSQGNVETFKRLLDAFLKTGETYFIVTGCEASISGADIEISPGFIYHDGEIKPYAGDTVEAPFYTPEVDGDGYFDPAGNEEFEDGVTRDTYQDDKAVIAFSTPSLTQEECVAAVNKLPRMSDGWKFNSVIEDWIPVAVNSPWATPSGMFTPDGEPVFKVRKAEGNKVEFAGGFVHPTGSPGAIATLPAGYRPDRTLFLNPLWKGTELTTSDHAIKILPTGVMSVLPFGGSFDTPTAYSLDGLSFCLDRAD